MFPMTFTEKSQTFFLNQQSPQTLKKINKTSD